MSLKAEFENQGRFFFRHRSFVPLVTIPLFIMAFRSHDYLFGSRSLNELWAAGCLLVSFLGLGIRIVTVGHAPKGTSGRNAHRQVAESLNTTGLYSLVRHLLYLGNFFIWLGIILFFHSWWFVLLMTSLFVIYYERIVFVEESFLHAAFGCAFESWAAVTPAIVPDPRRWRAPRLPFSWRAVLRREYPGFSGIAIVFAVLDFAGDSWIERRWTVDLPWIGLMVVATGTFLVLRTIKKMTRWLEVEGR